jgi:hypothetical protein
MDGVSVAIDLRGVGFDYGKMGRGCSLDAVIGSIDNTDQAAMCR